MLPNFKIILADVHFAKLYCVCACVSAYVFVMTSNERKLFEIFQVMSSFYLILYS